ncbi:hypothetical protein [Streptomyces gobitricini]|uniref:Uncharacterized protein n=1 Tax=Streptomyces gobitricini TaxID=68211 RepID=A0ABP6ABZ7_9ACTN
MRTNRSHLTAATTALAPALPRPAGAAETAPIGSVAAPATAGAGTGEL